MRLYSFLIKEKIGLSTFHLVCSYLQLCQLKLNSIISDEKMLLISVTLKDNDFKEWLVAKLKIEDYEIKMAKRKIATLYNENSKYNDLEIEQIINSLSYLIEKKAVPKPIELDIVAIIASNTNSDIEKIKQIKSVFIRFKQQQEQEREKIKKEQAKRQKLIEVKRRIREDYIDTSFDSDSEEAVMWALDNGYGELYGFG